MRDVVGQHLPWARKNQLRWWFRAVQALFLPVFLVACELFGSGFVHGCRSLLEHIPCHPHPPSAIWPLEVCGPFIFR